MISENLAQLFFDGSQTIQITVNLAGLEREFSPLQPRGMRCQTSLGLEQRLNDAFVLEVLRLNAFAVGESLSFNQVPSSATSSTVIDDTKPTIRYILPDLKQGSLSYTSRFVEFDFDRDHGWWMSHSRFGATLNADPPVSGGIRIQKFHDLGNGRFFPKTIVGYSLDVTGRKRPGPTTEITRCRINEPVKESRLVLETPFALPLSVEVRREGDLRVNKLQLKSSTGKSREFQEHDEFVQFAQSIKGQDEWTGSYSPPSYFDYHFQDARQAKALLQKAMGTDNVSSIRTGRAADNASYYLWGGLAVLAVVGLLAMPYVSRLRVSKE